MSDPERLLHGGGLEARLLSSALEPPPPDLLARTLGAVAAVTPIASTAAAKGAMVAAPKAGILGAVVTGALAGILTVGAAHFATSRDEAPRASTSIPAPLAVPSSVLPREVSARARAVEVHPAPSAAPIASAPSPPTSTLAAELALLDEARQALHAGDATRAEQLLHRYAREIPRGQLAREAALLRAEVEAAIDAGSNNP